MKQNDPIPCIGQSLPRKDAWAKVTGAEKYASDYCSPEMLIAGAKRAGIPHARIRHIDTAPAAAVAGVVAVLTHKDVGGTNRQGVIRKDQPVLADDRVRHCGDAVALVVAESHEALRRALARIRVAYDPLPGLFDPEQALEPDAIRIHDHNPDGNLLIEGVLEKEDVEAAFTACDHVVEGRFAVAHQEHAYLETEAGWAVLTDGSLHALTARIVYDTGPYDHLGGAVTALGLEHAGGPYRIPNTRLEARAAYTNNPVGGAFRAFGVAQVTAAMEQMLDMLCAEAGF